MSAKLCQKSFPLSRGGRVRVKKNKFGTISSLDNGYCDTCKIDLKLPLWEGVGEDIKNHPTASIKGRTSTH